MKRYATRNAADMVPLVGTAAARRRGSRSRSRTRATVELQPYDEPRQPHACSRGRRARARRWPPTCCSRATRARGAGVRVDRAGHYETLSRLVDGAQQIEIGAEASPYALNPWDVAEPGKVRAEKIAFLLACTQR